MRHAIPRNEAATARLRRLTSTADMDLDGSDDVVPRKEPPGPTRKPKATQAAAGTFEKIEVMRARFEAGEALHHPHDPWKHQQAWQETRGTNGHATTDSRRVVDEREASEATTRGTLRGCRGDETDEEYLARIDRAAAAFLARIKQATARRRA